MVDKIPTYKGNWYFMHNLTETLAEQLNITRAEIERRKKLLNFTEEDEKRLLVFKSLIAKNLSGIIKNFYDFMTSFSEVSSIIGDAETMRRLSSAMNMYVLDLFDGHYDENYVNKRLRIGLVHKRIGVPPELYLAGIYQLQLNLHNTMALCKFDEEKINGEFISVFAAKQSINKLLMFDMQFVLDTYFSSLMKEAEAAKEELDEYTSSLEKIIDKRTKELEELSMRDALTGLYNQRAFFEHLRRELSNAERYKESLVLCYFDLNNFKVVNDDEGHQVGDKILSLVGKIIENCLRGTDIGCRYGGDEFALILPHTTLDDTDVFAKRIIDAFQAEDMHGVSFSMGIASVGPEEFVNHEVLLKAADTEMYKAKAKAKKRTGFYISTIFVRE